MKIKTNLIAFSAAICVFASCSKTENEAGLSAASLAQSLENKISENGANPDEAIFLKQNNNAAINHFYIESNKSGINTILVFTQKQNGQLVLEDEVKSGGYGYGQALGSQGALAISKEYNLLFAVNAGSNSVSSFRINANTGGLQLLFTVNSNGQLPNSISVYENKLYVLNTSSSSICGYTFTSNGFLSIIEGSMHNLSGMAVDAPQIKFQPDGAAIYVTEKATNLIDKFDLDNNGAITSATYNQSHGVTPFGFDFGRDNHYLIVSNAGGGGSGAGSATSYKYNTSNLVDVNGAVSNFETSPCWLATTKYGSFAFVSNTTSNNISSYYVDKTGALTLIKAVAAANGRKTIDIAVSADNRYVYTIYSGTHSIVAYKRMVAGGIQFADKVSALPDYAAGLAAY